MAARIAASWFPQNSMESIMDGPFALERVHRPVPDEAVRMPAADGGQLPLEIILAYLEGRLELDVVCRYLVVHAKSVN